MDQELSSRRTSKGERRIPPTVAVVVAATAYILLPQSLVIGPRFVIPALELVLLLSLIVTNPVRIVRQTRWSRVASIALAGVVIVANLVTLSLLITTLDDSSTQGRPLLFGAIQVWVTNVIGFGLLFWELDRGGPVARRTERRDALPPADWRFSQDENDDAVAEVAATASATSGWIPTFVDYLYVSLTNSSAFSPTDTMPLSSRAKILMGAQASSALLVSLLLIARGQLDRWWLLAVDLTRRWLHGSRCRPACGTWRALHG